MPSTASESNNNTVSAVNDNAFDTGLNIRCACNNEININWDIVPITPQQYNNLLIRIGLPTIQQRLILNNSSNVILTSSKSRHY